MSTIPTISAEEQTFPLTKLILVVEHDVDFGTFLVQVIRKKTHYRAILATNGREAIKIIQQLKCDLFILDYNFPNVDGFELYDHLRTIRGYEGIPALFLNVAHYATNCSKQAKLEALLQTVLDLLDPEIEDPMLN
jgi:CheY-like chemotaxis protein